MEQNDIEVFLSSSPGSRTDKTVPQGDSGRLTLPPESTMEGGPVELPPQQGSGPACMKEKVKEKERENEKEKEKESPVHKFLGGGKLADVFLWRDKKISSGVLGFATAIWVLFERLEYHLLTLVCYVLILGLALLFLGSNAYTFINKSPPQFPEDILPEDIVLRVASALRMKLNKVFAIIWKIASGSDLKKFLVVIAGLWVFSILGDWCNFLTFFYISFVLLHTVPFLYEKYEAEIKKQYNVFFDKVLRKIPRGPLKDLKLA